MTMHVYTAKKQPATRYKVDLGKGFKPLVVRLHRQCHVWCQCCRSLRWAQNCVVQVYYDKTDFSCGEGLGCKNGGKKSAKRS